MDGIRAGFKKIGPEDFSLLKKWYGMTDSLGYATGFKTYEEIKGKILEHGRRSQFPLMVELKGAGTAGFVYAELKQADRMMLLWLHVLLIDPRYQRKGLGSWAVNRLLKTFNNRYPGLICIAPVAFDNKEGIAFWEKNGFDRSPEMESALSRFGSKEVAIMRKSMTMPVDRR